MRALAAESAGTALLVAAVVGSGIMGDRLAGGNVAIALLANSIATGGVLVALIFAFAPFSGAHFNPVVTVMAGLEGSMRWNRVILYLGAQIAGALAGVVTAHAMFGWPLFELGSRSRHGTDQWFSEVVATFGLLVVIHGTGRRPSVLPLTVGAYITAAYWFTGSTSFANPAVTFARAFTTSFSGIRLADVPTFVVAQCTGALLATILFRWLRQSEAQ